MLKPFIYAKPVTFPPEENYVKMAPQAVFNFHTGKKKAGLCCRFYFKGSLSQSFQGLLGRRFVN